MPKKKKRKKIKRKKTFKKKAKKIKKRLKKSKSKKIEKTELIYKTKSDWIKKAIVNKSGYEKKYSESLKNNDISGKKKVNELPGSNHTQKLKIINIARPMFTLNGFMMEL